MRHGAQDTSGSQSMQCLEHGFLIAIVMPDSAFDCQQLLTGTQSRTGIGRCFA